MSNKIFVFSTRFSFLKNKGENSYLFSSERCNEMQSHYELLVSRLNEEKVLEYMRANMKNNEKKVIDENCKKYKEYKESFERKRKESGVEELEAIGYEWEDFINNDLSDRKPKELLMEVGTNDYLEHIFYIFKLKQLSKVCDNISDDQENICREISYCQLKYKENIFAVNTHDRGDKERIEKICKAFGKGKEIFLLLHGDDLKEYYNKKVPNNVYVLKPDEIKKYSSIENLNILVFQHEKSKVIDILKNALITDIEESIENIFYEGDKKNKIFKKVKNVDEQFKIAAIENFANEIKASIGDIEKCVKEIFTKEVKKENAKN